MTKHPYEHVGVWALIVFKLHALIPVLRMSKASRPRGCTQTSVVRRVYSRISHNCLWFLSHFPAQMSLWQTQWGQHCRSDQRKTGPLFTCICFIHLLLAAADSRPQGCWNQETGRHRTGYHRSPFRDRTPDPHSGPHPLCGALLIGPP